MKWIAGIVALTALAAGWIWLQSGKERLDVVRAHVSGALYELSAAKDAVTEEFVRDKALPKAREFKVADKHVRSISLEPQGRLVMTLSFPDSPAADGKHVVYEPRIAGTEIAWRCSSPDLESRYLPVNCR
jgi:hypothetical protein